MRTIILIIPYFGKWPPWMDLYLYTIEKNPSINFLFVTDCDVSVLGDILNVKYQHISFQEYIDHYRKLLNNDIRIENPYKICDLRPFFGVIHEEDIKGYDFFGWTDTDILFGDIRSFYTDEILKKYEVLSTHAIRLSGHFALLQNTYFYRTLGYRVYKWKEALQNPSFIGIDEHGLTNALCMTIGDKFAEKFKFSKNNWFLNLVRRLKMRKYYFVEQYTTPFTSIPWIDGSLHSNQPDEWYYNNGEITNNRDDNRKFMYLHFMNFKSSLWRHDGTKAPWETEFNYEVKSFNDLVTINSKGISSNERGKPRD